MSRNKRHFVRLFGIGVQRIETFLHPFADHLGANASWRDKVRHQEGLEHVVQKIDVDGRQRVSPLALLRAKRIRQVARQRQQGLGG